MRVGAARATVALVAAGVLTGCSGADSDWKPVAEDEVSLDEAVMAMYLSPQSHTFDGRHNSGYVLLVDPDGTTRMIRTTGMDTALMAWTEAGLFFADDQRDYLLDEEGLVTTASPKPNVQISLDVVDGAFVAIYNDGFTDTGYRTDLVVHRDGQSQSYVLEGFPTVVSRCADGLVGVADASGRFAEYPVDEAEDLPAQLVQWLWPGPQEMLASQAAASDDWHDHAKDAPCVDGVVHALTSQPHGEPNVDGLRRERSILRSWNTFTGERTDYELLDGQGQPLPLEIDQMSQSRYGEHSVRGDELWWWGADGTVRATGLRTGRTRELFTTKSEFSSTNVAEVVFTKDYLFVLDIRNEDTSEELGLSRYALATGEREEVVRIRDVNPRLSTDLVLRGIAIKPDNSP